MAAVATQVIKKTKGTLDLSYFNFAAPFNKQRKTQNSRTAHGF